MALVEGEPLIVMTNDTLWDILSHLPREAILVPKRGGNISVYAGEKMNPETWTYLGYIDFEAELFAPSPHF